LRSSGFDMSVTYYKNGRKVDWIGASMWYNGQATCQQWNTNTRELVEAVGNLHVTAAASASTWLGSLIIPGWGALPGAVVGAAVGAGLWGTYNWVVEPIVGDAVEYLCEELTTLEESPNEVSEEAFNLAYYASIREDQLESSMFDCPIGDVLVDVAGCNGDEFCSGTLRFNCEEDMLGGCDCDLVGHALACYDDDRCQ